MSTTPRRNEDIGEEGDFSPEQRARVDSLRKSHRNEVYENEEAQQEPAVAREYVSHSCCTNCVITTALAALLCRRKCDANRVVADFAFFPPKPPTYSARTSGHRSSDQPSRKRPSSSSAAVGETNEVRLIEWKYRDLERNPIFARFRFVDGRDGRPACRLLKTARSQLVPSFFFEAPGISSLRGNDALRISSASSSSMNSIQSGSTTTASVRPRTSLCLIYFHANATDCGAMLPTYSTLSRRLGVAVLAIEYTGYGGSTGRPSVPDTYADADAAYNEARRRGFSDDKIVLYGQSVGSGPACYLAARKSHLAGLILHSPIASGIRSLTGGGCCSPIYVYACLDPFNNLKELKKAYCPTLIIHGTRDEEIPCAHGKMLHEVARNKHHPFWVDGAGHNDILETNEDLYFAKLHDFLLHVIKARANNKLLALPSPADSNPSDEHLAIACDDVPVAKPMPPAKRRTHIFHWVTRRRGQRRAGKCP